MNSTVLSRRLACKWLVGGLLYIVTSSLLTSSLLTPLLLASLARADEAVAAAHQEKPDEEKPAVSFRRQVAPILIDNCLPCHGTKKAEGGYRVDTFAELLKPGDSGLEPVVASNIAESELARRLTCDESERMPADDEPLAEQQIELIGQWIAAGGSFDGDEAERQQPLGLVMPPIDYPSPPEHYPATFPVTAVCFAADGSQLVTSGYHELLVWNVADGSLLRRIANVGERTHALEFSADGKTLAVGGGEPGKRGEVRLLDFESGQLTRVVSRGGDVILGLAFRPGTDQLATASADGLIRIIDLNIAPNSDSKTGEEVRTLASHADWVTGLAWSPDGSRLVSTSRDKSAKVYDTSSWELVSSYLGHAAPVRGVVVTTDQQQALTVGADNQLHRWNLADGARVAAVAIGAEAFAVELLEGACYVATADQRLRKVNLGDNSVNHVFDGHTSWVLCLDTHDGRLASGSLSGEVRIWSVSDNQPLTHWLAKP